MMTDYRFCASDVIRGHPNGPNVAQMSLTRGPRWLHDGPENAQERPKGPDGVHYSAPPFGHKQYRNEGTSIK